MLEFILDFRLFIHKINHARSFFHVYFSLTADDVQQVELVALGQHLVQHRDLEHVGVNMERLLVHLVQIVLVGISLLVVLNIINLLGALGLLAGRQGLASRHGRHELVLLWELAIALVLVGLVGLIGHKLRGSIHIWIVVCLIPHLLLIILIRMMRAEPIVARLHLVAHGLLVAQVACLCILDVVSIRSFLTILLLQKWLHF